MTGDEESESKKKERDDVSVGVPRGLIVFLVVITSLAILAIYFVNLIPTASASQITLIITALYTGLTGAYVYMTTLQWVAVREQLRMARETNALTLRAWIGLDDFPEFVLSADAPLLITVPLENVGALPATGKVECLRWISGPSEWHNSPPPGAITHRMGFVAGRGQTVNITLHTEGLSALEVADINDHLLVLRLRATISYSDPIGTRGVTTVDAFYRPSSKSFALIGQRDENRMA